MTFFQEGITKRVQCSRQITEHFISDLRFVALRVSFLIIVSVSKYSSCYFNVTLIYYLLLFINCCYSRSKHIMAKFTALLVFVLLPLALCKHFDKGAMEQILEANMKQGTRTCLTI